MTVSDSLSTWQRWVRQPQKIWLRRAFFQIHLWSGIVLGLYIFMMSVTGSILVYRNELYRAATAPPIISSSSAPRLTDEQLTQAALRLYPGVTVTSINHARNLDQAVDIWMRQGHDVRKRMFDPRTGVDLGNSVPRSFKLVSDLLDLHDNLLAGTKGRNWNGVGAVALLLLAGTGAIVWWPGVKTWRRSLTIPKVTGPRGIGWQRMNWHLHSMIGFWTLGFTIIFALSGIYLVIPGPIQDFADRIQPPTAFNGGTRLVDKVIYWLAYLHFGRIQGIGIPCNGPGVCDQATKAVWALFGIAPAVMLVTGAIMWWNRVMRPRMARRANRAQAVTGTG